MTSKLRPGKRVELAKRRGQGAEAEAKHTPCPRSKRELGTFRASQEVPSGCYGQGRLDGAGKPVGRLGQAHLICQAKRSGLDPGDGGEPLKASSRILTRPDLHFRKMSYG